MTRAGASGVKLLRADSGFWNKKLIARLQQAGWQYSISTVIVLPQATVRTARTLRRRLLQIPGRLTRTARQWTLHLPARWPWQHDFIRALNRIRALPALV